MSLSDVLTELQNRSTFGTTVVLNDGNLRISEGVAPDRIAILGSCSNSASNARGTDYLIPTGVPFRLTNLRDLRYLKNDDPDQTPSEISLAFEDAYNGGGRSFEVVILTRTVAQLASDVTAAATTLPVSTIYTGRLTPTGTMGAHPLGNVNCTVFAHNNDIFFCGGERPDTPATGAITCVAEASMADGDYILFTHTDGTVHAFWFDVSGSATEPAGVTAAVAAGTEGSTSTEVSINGAGTNDAVADLLMAAIDGSNLPITGFDSGAGTIALESDEASTAGNAWTLTETVTNAGFLVTTPAGGAATNTISRRIMQFDPATDTWSNAVNADGVPQRLVVGTRDAGAVRESTTQVNITGGMTTILGGADTAVATVDDITFASASSSVVSSVAAGTAVNTDLTTIGEAAWVQAGSTWYIIGGQTGGGTRSDMIATFVPSTGVATDTTVNLAAAKRWAGAYWQSSENRIYIFGGETASGAVATTEAYDVPGVAMLAAATAGNMSEAKYDFGFAGVNGAGWAFGGYTGSANTSRIERFDPDTHTWQRKDELGVAGILNGTANAERGGRAVVDSNHIFYADGDQGYDFNIGLGNLSDTYVGFPSSYPFYIQVDWEIMSVTGVTTTRAGGRDVDAFIVTRGQRGSTALAHTDRVDVVRDPNQLYTELESAYENMIESSQADYIVVPSRVVIDCPYLAAGSNFAWQLAEYCYLKTRFDRACMGVIGVMSPTQDPTAYPTAAEETAWLTAMTNFSRNNYDAQNIFSIADGITDSNEDRKPDTYAFWATSDGVIPVGSPPMEAGNLLRDDNNQPIDLGRHLFVVYPYGFANTGEWARKFPSADFGYLRNAAASYAGSLTRLETSQGSTNMAVAGFTPYKLFSMVQENRLNRRRFLGIVNRVGTGLRWNTGYTFAWNVSQFSRSDYVLGSTFRKQVHLTKVLRAVIERYYGRSTLGQHLNAFQVDIANAIKELVDNGVVGRRTDFEFRVSRTDRIIGHGTLVVNVEFEGELTQVTMVVNQQALE